MLRALATELQGKRCISRIQRPPLELEMGRPYHIVRRWPCRCASWLDAMAPRGIVLKLHGAQGGVT
eukprot:scaffold1951_cov258-Pinguiococcus_pyrenoidosus.AAC.6